MRRAFLVDERWIDTILDEGRLMFHRFVHDGVDLVIGHDLEEIGCQFFSRQEIFIMCSRGGALVQRSRERLLTFGKFGEFFASSRDL